MLRFNRWRAWAVEDGLRSISGGAAGQWQVSVKPPGLHPGGQATWKLIYGGLRLHSSLSGSSQDTEKSVTAVEDTSFHQWELQAQKDQPNTVKTITPFISKLTAMRVLSEFPEVL